jgi:hypothetical protein
LDKLTAIEKKLANPELKSSQDVLNFAPALDHQFAGLARVASSADTKPTESSWVFLKQIQGQVDGALAEWKTAVEKDLADFNKTVREKDVPPVVVAPKKEAFGRGIRFANSGRESASLGTMRGRSPRVGVCLV